MLIVVVVINIRLIILNNIGFVVIYIVMLFAISLHKQWTANENRHRIKLILLL